MSLYSRDRCITDAHIALQRTVGKICAEIDADLKNRGIAKSPSSPHLPKVFDAIRDFEASVIECDKATALRQLARIRESGSVQAFSPFSSPYEKSLLNAVCDAIRFIPLYLHSASRLLQIDEMSSAVALAIERATTRIGLEYQAMEAEFQRDILAILGSIPAFPTQARSVAIENKPAVTVETKQASLMPDSFIPRLPDDEKFIAICLDLQEQFMKGKTSPMKEARKYVQNEHFRTEAERTRRVNALRQQWYRYVRKSKR